MMCRVPLRYDSNRIKAVNLVIASVLVHTYVSFGRWRDYCLEVALQNACYVFHMRKIFLVTDVRGKCRGRKFWGNEAFVACK